MKRESKVLTMTQPRDFPDSHFAFLHFFSMGMVLIPVSYTMGKLVSYSTANLGVRGTLRNRVGGGSSEEKKQAEYLAPGRRRNIVHRGVGPGQRSGPSLKEV